MADDKFVEIDEKRYLELHAKHGWKNSLARICEPPVVIAYAKHPVTGESEHVGRVPLTREGEPERYEVLSRFLTE